MRADGRKRLGDFSKRKPSEALCQQIGAARANAVEVASPGIVSAKG
jgi:hypothetical protein